MKYTTIRLLSTALVFLGCFWQPLLAQDGIQFEHGTWDEVLEKAQREEKPIFVDAYTTWCGPCKWMAREVFTQAGVGSYINNHFVAYKMDMEAGDGPAFAKANNVMAYPTLLYFDSRGKLLHKAAGARDAEGLIQLCKDALSPEKQLGSYIKRYAQGERSKEFLAAYLPLLSESGEDLTQPLQEYWDQLSPEERHTEAVLDMMAMATGYFGDLEAPLTQYLIEHRKDYEAVAGANTVRNYLWRTYTQSAVVMASTSDQDKAKRIEEQLLKLFPEAKRDLKERVRLWQVAEKHQGKEKRIQRAYERYLKHSIDGNDLNEAAWAIYEDQEASAKDLKRALGYVARAVAYMPDFSTYDTKGALLFRLERYSEAKTALERSISNAEDQGVPEEYIASTRGMLKAINDLLGETEE